MKPCPRCRDPLHNKAKTCPCGWEQAPGGIGVQQAEPFEPPIPPRDATWRDAAHDIVTSTFTEGLPGMIAVGVGAGLGYYMADTIGLAVGVAIGVGLFALTFVFG